MPQCLGKIVLLHQCCTVDCWPMCNFILFPVAPNASLILNLKKIHNN